MSTATFWDDPRAKPANAKIQVGETVSGTVTGLELATSRSGDDTIRYAIDGVWRYTNKRLHNALWSARPLVGDRVEITRLPDDPPRESGITATNWTVRVVARADQPATNPAVVGVTLPSW